MLVIGQGVVHLYIAEAAQCDCTARARSDPVIEPEDERLQQRGEGVAGRL
jgi:hypothetical protein